VLTRLIGRLEKVLPNRINNFPNRTRSARRRMQEIQRMTARQRHDRQQDKYRQLIGITQQVVHNARGILEKTKDQCGLDLMDDLVIGELRRKIDHYCQLGDRVIYQSWRRVLEGNPSDHVHVTPSLKRHKETFGFAPAWYSSDRGFFSDENIKACRDVKLVCIPQRGGKRTAPQQALEKSPEFKKGQRFRAG